MRVSNGFDDTILQVCAMRKCSIGLLTRAWEYLDNCVEVCMLWANQKVDRG